MICKNTELHSYRILCYRDGFITTIHRERGRHRALLSHRKIRYTCSDAEMCEPAAFISLSTLLQCRSYRWHRRVLKASVTSAPPKGWSVFLNKSRYPCAYHNPYSYVCHARSNGALRVFQLLDDDVTMSDKDITTTHENGIWSLIGESYFPHLSGFTLLGFF